MPLDKIYDEVPNTVTLDGLSTDVNAYYKKQTTAGIPKNKFEFFVLPSKGTVADGGGKGTAAGAIAVAKFKSISGLDADVEQLSWQTGDSQAEIKLPGKISHTNITLERGYLDKAILPRQWFSQKGHVFGQSDNYMLDCCIVVKSAAGDPVRLILIRNAWVVKYKPSDLQADSLDPWTENIELAHEGWAFSNDEKTIVGSFPSASGKYVGDYIWKDGVYTPITIDNFFTN